MIQSLKNIFTYSVLLTLALNVHAGAKAPTYSPTYDLKRPMPKGCYTQGLSLDTDDIWLSCGQYNQSKIYRLQHNNWDVISQMALPDQWFAEGIAAVGDRLILLTWKNELIARIDKKNLLVINTESFPGEAWGLTNAPDGNLLISDGSSVLRWLKPDDLSKIKHVNVKDGNRSVTKLNELEWVGDYVWANIWQSNRIAIIAPSSGQIKAWLDVSELSQHERKRGGEVLNGILYNPDEKAVYITGKWWQYAYRLPLDQFYPTLFKSP